MAWIRESENGNWKATIRTDQPPPNNRLTRTFGPGARGEKDARNWAALEEAKISTGSWMDPRLGDITVGELWDEFAADRRLETASRKRDEYTWGKWVEPAWGKHPIGPIRKPHVEAWVVRMERGDYHDTPAKGWTIDAAVKVLGALLEIAVGMGYIGFNASRRVKKPAPEPHTDRILEEWEDSILLDNLRDRFPDRPQEALFVETLLYTGLRYEELAPLDRAHLVVRDRRIQVASVMEKDGTIRPYPKSPWSVRPVPVDDSLWPRLLEQAMTAAPDRPFFTAPDGGPQLYDNWLKRVWNQGLIRRVPMSEAEIEQWKQERRAAGYRSAWRVDYFHEVPILGDPQPTPHDCRHTFGTRLADAGMPEKDIAALMGHSPKSTITKRYLHAREGRHDKARAAMASVRQLRRAA